MNDFYKRRKIIILNALIVIALVLCTASPEGSSLRKWSLIAATAIAIANFANSIYPKKEE